MRSKYSHKNNPRLGGLLLDVIPQQFEKYQPLDTFILAKLAFFVNIFSRNELNGHRSVTRRRVITVNSHRKVNYGRLY